MAHPWQTARWVTLAVATLGACNLRDPHMLLRVEAPTSMAMATQTLHVGPSLTQLKRVRLTRLQFPVTITVYAAEASDRIVWVEARDGGGLVLGRGRTEAKLKRRGAVAATVTLTDACSVDAQCDDLTYCNGPETCQEGRCLPGAAPCPASFPCVLSNQCVELGEGEGNCDVEVDHDACEPYEYCDLQSGCTPGGRCETSAQCQDASYCNGEEVCVCNACVGGPCGDENDENADVRVCIDGHCELRPGPVPPSDGDDCTWDVCDPDRASQGLYPFLHIPNEALDGQPCRLTPESGTLDGICLHFLGGCVQSLCGDGFWDPSMEQCDDGNIDNTDACIQVTADNGELRCLNATCGDGFTWAAKEGEPVREVCDDHNQVSGDGCRADCNKIEICGDGVIDFGEPCDDDNGNPNDGCDQCRRTGWLKQVIAGQGPAGDDATRLPLLGPTSVRTDRDGNIYVADALRNRVWRIHAQTHSTNRIAGNGRVGIATMGGRATTTPLLGPVALALDGLGNLYVAERDRFRVLQIDIRGNVEAVAGVAGESPAAGDPVREHVAAVLTRLAQPTGVAVDGSANLLLSETAAGRVRRVDAVTGLITTLTDTILRPTRLATDGAGNAYVCDSDARTVWRWRAADGQAEPFIGGGASTAENVDALDVQLGDPVDVAIDEPRSRLYVADPERRRVLRLDLATMRVTTLAGNGTTGQPVLGGPAAASPMMPESVAVEPDGSVLVADRHSAQIWRVRSGTETLEHVAGRGADADMEQTLLALAMRRSVDAIAAAPLKGLSQGIAIVGAEAHVILLGNLLPDEQGLTLHVAGTGEPGYRVGDHGAAAIDALLNEPHGVAVDAGAFVYFADTGNHRVRRLRHICFSDPPACQLPADTRSLDKAPVLSQMTLEDFAGCAPGSATCDCDPTATPTCDPLRVALSSPVGVAVDVNQAYVDPSAPSPVPLLSDDRVFIADTGNHRLLRIDLVDGLLRHVAATGVPGYSEDPATPGSATAAQLDEPRGILHVEALSTVIHLDDSPVGAVDALVDMTDAVLIADRRNHRIRVYAEGALVHIPGAGDEEKGPLIATLIGDGLPGADPTHLTFPRGFARRPSATDSTSGLYVVDSFDRVSRIAVESRELIPLAGGVQPMGDGPLATSELETPVHLTALSTDATTWVVADQGAGTLRRLVTGPAAELQTVVGFPEGDEAEGYDAAHARLLDEPTGVAFDAETGRLYVSEAGADRILRIETTSTPWTLHTLVADTELHLPGEAVRDVPSLMRPHGLLLVTCEETDGDPCGSCAPRLYVADTGNHVVRTLALRISNPQSTVIAGTPGVRGFFGEGSAAAEALLNAPEALARGPDGSLYIADTANHRVRRVTCDGIITTVVGDGRPASGGVGSPARFFPVDEPRALGLDPFGNLFVTSHRVVRMVVADPVATGSSWVSHIYGTPPATAYPEPVTRCLSGVAVAADDSILVLDACAGFVIELTRQVVESPGR